MTIWDFYAWVGIVTIFFLCFRLIHFTIETILVVRVGWDTITALGFWRSIPEAIFRPNR